MKNVMNVMNDLWKLLILGCLIVSPLRSFSRNTPPISDVSRFLLDAKILGLLIRTNPGAFLFKAEHVFSIQEVNNYSLRFVDRD